MLFITLILYSQDLPHWKSYARYAIHHSHTILTRSTTLEAICQVCYSSLSYYTHKIYHVGSHLPGMLFITLILYSQDLSRWKSSARYAIHHSHTILTRSTTLEAICQVCYSSPSFCTHKIYHVGSHMPGMLFFTLILYSQDLPARPGTEPGSVPGHDTRLFTLSGWAQHQLDHQHGRPQFAPCRACADRFS